MSSPIYNEWVEEERREAAERASGEATYRTSLKVTKAKIMGALEIKFEFVPKLIRESIEEINDIDILDGLFKKFIEVSSIEEFKESLNKAKMLS